MKSVRIDVLGTCIALLESIRGDQRGGSQVNWKNGKMIIPLPLLFQLFLKYVYMVDILIHQFTHMKFKIALC